MSPETVDLTVVVPTYREVENLVPLVDRVFQAVTAAGITAEVIVVDDDSRDGTDAKCEGLARRYNLRLITRKGERGLATAVLAGFRAGKGRFLLCMDADLSHHLGHPTDGPGPLGGGGVRHCFPLCGRRGRRERLGALPLSELEAGDDARAAAHALSATRSAATLPCPAECSAARWSPPPLGYKIALELLVRSRPGKIAEIPIYFQDRKFGSEQAVASRAARVPPTPSAARIVQVSFSVAAWEVLVRGCRRSPG